MTTKTSKLTPRATIGHKSEHPTLLNHILVLAALICLVSAQTTTTTGTCKISQTTPKKASPSLVQCYRNNANSCCNSITDDYIKSQYTGLFSGSCARNFAVSCKQKIPKKCKFPEFSLFLRFFRSSRSISASLAPRTSRSSTLSKETRKRSKSVLASSKKFGETSKFQGRPPTSISAEWTSTGSPESIPSIRDTSYLPRYQKTQKNQFSQKIKIWRFLTF